MTPVKTNTHSKLLEFLENKQKLALRDVELFSMLIEEYNELINKTNNLNTNNNFLKLVKTEEASTTDGNR